MADLVRALNGIGVERFRGYLADLRAGADREPPWDLLYADECTAELVVEIRAQRQRFASRWGLGQYLNDLLLPLPPADVDGNVGLWSWLSLYFFDQVCPARAGRVRRPGQDYRHVPDFGFRYRHRHLLYGPYAVYRRHRGHAVLLLAGPPHVESTIYHEIASRTDLIADRGVVECTHLLYLDRKRGLPKRGAQGPKAKPGTIVRFIRVLQQLDVTFDVYGMSGKEILELLPPEFDQWR